MARLRSLLVVSLLGAAVLLLHGPVGVAAPACTISWTGPAGGSWHTAANWNLARVPAAADVACIGGGSTVTYSTGVTTIPTLLNAGTVTQTGGTLNLTAAAADESTSAAYTLQSGILGGAGTLAVTGSLTWTGGSMANTGTTRIEPGATLIRAQQNNVFLESGRVVDNRGTLDFRTDQFISQSGAPAPMIRNTGTVLKSAGSGTATVLMALENNGVVRSQSGTLDLRGGGGAIPSGGDYGDAASTGTVQLGSGNLNLADGARLLGGVTVNGAFVDVVDAATAAASGANTLAAGALGGLGTMRVTGALTWTGGSIVEAGTTRIEPAGSLVRNGPNTVFLETGRVVDNRGTIDLRSDRLISQSGVPAPLILNTGTVRKSDGLGVGTIGPALENDGVVDSQSGTLDLRGGDATGSSSGSVGGGAGVVSISAGTFDLADGAQLFGGVVLGGAVVNVLPGSTVIATGANTLSAGRVAGTGVFRVDGSLSWTGGSMSDPGTTQITATATLAREGVNTVFLETGRLLEIVGTLELRADRFISPSGVPAPLIRNLGTVVKTVGPGTASISSALENDGVVRSQVGVLDVRGGDGSGTSAGDWGALAAPGTVLLSQGTTDLADGARLLGGVDLGGGTLNVAAGATARASGGNTFSSGSLGGLGTLLVGGTLTWTGGSMLGAGTTTIEPTATLVSSGSNLVFLETGRVLENDGTIDLRNDKFLNESGVPAPRIHNDGTIVKSAGAGTAGITPVLENDGAVQSQSGSLNLHGGDGAGSSDGGFSGVGSARVGFAAGTYELTSPTALGGGIRIAGGRLTVPTGVTLTAAGTTEFAFGNVDGGGTFRIGGPFAWTGGTMGGAGITLVPAGREVALTVCCPALGGTRRLVNEGTIVVDGGGLSAPLATRVENNAVLQFSGDGGLLSGGGRLVNTATIVKSSGIDESSILLPVANSGSIRSEAGTLSLSVPDPAEQSGTFGATGAAELELSAGKWTLGPGSRLTGGVKIGPGDVAVSAGYRLPIEGVARLTNNGGIAGPGTAEILGSFAWEGGTMGPEGRTVVAPGASVTIDEASGAYITDRALLNRGTLTVTGGDFEAFGGAILNEGTIDLQGDASVDGGLFGFTPFATIVHNTGTIRKTTGVSSSVSGLIDNDGTFEALSGTLALQGELMNASSVTRSLTSGGYVARNATVELPGLPLQVNAATIVLDGPSAAVTAREFEGDDDVNALATLERNAGAGELRLEHGATLTLGHSFRNAGLLDVGSDGTLNVTGTFIQSGGALGVEAAPSGVGRLNATAAAGVAGALIARTTAGFTPAAGAIFRFLQAGAAAGTFAPVLEVRPDVDYDVEYDATGVQLRRVGAGAGPGIAPAPTSTALDDRQLVALRGPWTRRFAPGFYEGTYTVSSRKGATLIRPGVAARSISILVGTCRRGGTLDVYLDGRRLKRVRLAGRPRRKLVQVAAFGSVRTGTVTLRVASARREVRIDGLLISA